jgi:3-oxoacyl-[acyl-carrier protein] reductase
MLEGKVALITGASQGLGRALALAYAKEGASIVINARSEEGIRPVAEEAESMGAEVLALAADVSKSADVERLMDAATQRFGRIDVLVNNAGWSKIEPVAEMAPETWRRCMAVDLDGTFHCMRHALPHMIRQGGGAIVNISSIAAWEPTDEHGAAYAAAKAGVLALTRVAAAENGRHGVRVNAVAPGLIYNDFLRRIYPDEFFSGYAQERSRVGRVGRPEDVAALVAFLTSDEAGYITGEVYGISGGVFPHG